MLKTLNWLSIIIEPVQLSYLSSTEVNLENSYVVSVACSLGAASSHSFRDLSPSLSLFLYIKSFLGAHFYRSRHENNRSFLCLPPLLPLLHFLVTFTLLSPWEVWPLILLLSPASWASPLQHPLLFSGCLWVLEVLALVPGPSLDHCHIPPFTCTVLCLAASPGKYLKECTHSSRVFPCARFPTL